VSFKRLTHLGGVHINQMPDVPASPQCLDLGSSNVPFFPITNTVIRFINVESSVNLFCPFRLMSNYRYETNVGEENTSMNLHDKH